MKAKDFNFNAFLDYKEEKDKNYTRFLKNDVWEIPIIQMASSSYWEGICRYKEKSFEAQLDFLTDTTKLKTDLVFSYLEPWLGVGIYAAAYGCKYIWHGNDSPQVLPIYQSLDDVRSIKHPSIESCDEMNAVLEMIKYFKEQTGGLLDISMTDTQSPNDTASLLLSTTEFFTATLEEPEALESLLNSITKLIVEFSECQMELIGDSLALPGHIMPSYRCGSGISISDDNMAFISPPSYAETCVPYNSKLSNHFEGISIHTCGNAGHNLALLRDTPGLQMVDLALGLVADPSPNDATRVADVFRNTDIIVKAKVGWDEIERITPLIDPSIRLIVQLFTSGTIDDRNRQFNSAQEAINQLIDERKKN